MEKILVTGAAGFIGFHLCQLLQKDGHVIVGIDNLNNYYDVNLKLERLKVLQTTPGFRFQAINICDRDSLNELFSKEAFTVVINLAAQAGVRYSIEKPLKYLDSNLIGFVNILEACRRYPVKHFLFASSSSVYGANKEIPFSTSHVTDTPLSLYAATKKANELMAHSYASMYKIPSTGLRFFTVYGPWGRPDMAYFTFTEDILHNRTLKVFNNGKMMRDFTYIDDITFAISKLVTHPPSAAIFNESLDEIEGGIPYKIFNIGNNKPISIMAFIETLEDLLQKKAQKEYHDMQKGDMQNTYANIDDLSKTIGYNPATNIREGLKNFVEWYKSYYKI